MTDNGDNSGRFLVLEKLFKIAGTPVVSEGLSLLYRVYRPIVVICGYLTLVTTFMGIVDNVDDIDHVMEAARLCFVMINLLWMHFFIRYSPASGLKYSDFSLLCFTMSTFVGWHRNFEEFLNMQR
jgi:hypothetical protein